MEIPFNKINALLLLLISPAENGGSTYISSSGDFLTQRPAIAQSVLSCKTAGGVRRLNAEAGVSIKATVNRRLALFKVTCGRIVRQNLNVNL